MSSWPRVLTPSPSRSLKQSRKPRRGRRAEPPGTRTGQAEAPPPGERGVSPGVCAASLSSSRSPNRGVLAIPGASALRSGDRWPLPRILGLVYSITGCLPSGRPVPTRAWFGGGHRPVREAPLGWVEPESAGIDRKGKLERGRHLVLSGVRRSLEEVIDNQRPKGAGGAAGRGSVSWCCRRRTAGPGWERASREGECGCGRRGVDLER